jgi:AraC-like DNA-binding protein
MARKKSIRAVGVDGKRGSQRARVVAAHCRLFLRELRARGIDPRRQLLLLGIDYPEDEDLTHFISAAQFTAFLHLVEELSGDPDIGLLAGEGIRVEDTGLLGLLVRSSADGQSAYEHCTQYNGAVQDTLDLETSLLDGVLICRRRVMHGVPASRILSEYFLARTLVLTRQLLGPLDPLEVRLMHPRPPDIREHSRIFGERLSFRQHEDAIALSADVLSRPMLHRDSVTSDMVSRHVSQQQQQHGLGTMSTWDLTNRVRQAIVGNLSHGRGSMGEVASQLMLSERTLHRHLREQGTSFQRLLDDVRRDCALQYLQEARYSALELSARLGFRGTAAFYRAFRRWTGSSLSDYRADRISGTRSPGRDR